MAQTLNFNIFIIAPVIAAILAVIMPILAIVRANTGGGIAMYWIGMVALVLTTIVLYTMDALNQSKKQSDQDWKLPVLSIIVLVVFSVAFWRRRGSLRGASSLGD